MYVNISDLAVFAIIENKIKLRFQQYKPVGLRCSRHGAMVLAGMVQGTFGKQIYGSRDLRI